MQSSAAQGGQRQAGGERGQQQGPALPPSHPPHPQPPHHHSHPHGSGGMEVGPWTSPGLQALGDPAAQGSLDSAASGSGRLLHGLQSGAGAGPGGAGSRSQLRAQWERGGSSERLARQQSLAMSRKTLSPSPGQLGLLRLREGQNSIRYKVGSSELVAFIYFYRWSVKLVISDIDGTITRSDVLGHLLPAMGWDWSHAGISRLFTDITSNKYQIMYLSSRSISQANITRDYINSLVQGKHRMPLGPVIISPHGLLPSLYREMILRRPHEFKIATLLDIRSLFPPDWNPFYAGFGNRSHSARERPAGAGVQGQGFRDSGSGVQGFRASGAMSRGPWHGVLGRDGCC
ncbi:Lipin/Ned1/Smp2-domain-containing protein [Haematococcus lacustris]